MRWAPGPAAPATSPAPITITSSWNKSLPSGTARASFSHPFTGRLILAIREKAPGPDYPDAAISLNNLAVLYRAQGRYAEAEPLYKRALAISKKALGSEHPNVAAIMENYAVLLRKTERGTEATKMEARTKAIRAKHAEENP